MSTIAAPTPTAGIAGRYFVAERRERFLKLTARVTLLSNVINLPTRTITLGNDAILSPRRIARQTGLGGADANKVADTIHKMMSYWSLSGFPTQEVPGDPTLRCVDVDYPTCGVRVRLQDGGQL